MHEAIEIVFFFYSNEMHCLRDVNEKTINVDATYCLFKQMGVLNIYMYYS